MRRIKLLFIVSVTLVGISLYSWLAVDPTQTVTNDPPVESEFDALEIQSSSSKDTIAPISESTMPPEERPTPELLPHDDVSTTGIADSNQLDDRNSSSAPVSVSTQIRNRFDDHRFDLIHELSELAFQQSKDPFWSEDSEKRMRAKIVDHFGDVAPHFSLECFETVCTLDLSANGQQIYSISKLLHEHVYSDDDFLGYYFIQKMDDGFHTGFLFRNTFKLSDLDDL